MSKIVDSFIEKAKSRITEKVADYTKRIAYSIYLKGRMNLAKAVRLTSNTQAYDVRYSKIKADGRIYEYEIIFDGPQIAFLEFGTGTHNEPFMSGVVVGGADKYVPRIADGRVPDRGGYGKGLGEHITWVFPFETNVSTENGDFVISKKKYLRKRDGGLSVYTYDPPIIVTHGIQPQRMIYRSIQETLKEVRKIGK